MAVSDLTLTSKVAHELNQLARAHSYSIVFKEHSTHDLAAYSTVWNYDIAYLDVKHDQSASPETRIYIHYFLQRNCLGLPCFFMF